MNRRKFLQISAFVCAAPVISKIDSIASLNADACLIDPIGYGTGRPPEWYTFLEENLSTMVQRMMLEEKVFNSISQGKEVF